MKKIVSVALSFALVLSLAACSSSSSSSTSTTAAASSETAAAADTAEPAAEADAAEAAQNNGEPVYINENAAELTGEVRLLTAFTGPQGTDQLIEDFNSYYPNVTVTYETYVNDADGNLSANTYLQAGNCDVILSFDVRNASFRWQNGMFMDIADRLEADNLDLVKEWGTDVYKYNGGVYGIPADTLSVFVAINMDMWNEAGLGDIPDYWTWDEYLDACRAMTKRDDAGNVTVYGGTNHNQKIYWTYALGQTKGVNTYYNEEGQADFLSGLSATILHRQLDAEEEGIWYPQINLITDSTKARDLLWTGDVASCIESIITRFVMETDDYPHDFILGFAPWPVNEDGEINYMLGPMMEGFYSVTSNCQDADAAYAFAKFASTYGGKYMYKAGHAATWTGQDPDEIVDLVFGSREIAEQYVDVDSYIDYVVALNEPAYRDEEITAFAEITELVEEYTTYILSREMTVEDGLAELNQYANDAIAEALAAQ